MNWTSELPTEPGFYWFRCSPKHTATVVSVTPMKFQDDLEVDGWSVRIWKQQHPNIQFCRCPEPEPPLASSEACDAAFAEWWIEQLQRFPNGVGVDRTTADNMEYAFWAGYAARMKDERGTEESNQPVRPRPPLGDTFSR